MKTYVMTTGTVFGLLALVHVWRAIGEERHLATDPTYILITLAAASLSAWAYVLLWRTRRPAA